MRDFKALFPVADTQYRGTPAAARLGRSRVSPLCLGTVHTIC